MKVLVTGFPGTGKSAVAHELKEHGYNAYDPESMQGYMHLEDRSTGRPTHMPVNPPRGWFDTTGAYNLDIPKLSKLLASHDDIIVCTLADNQDELFELFDKVFVLILDDYYLEKRLLERTNNSYGKNANDRADTLMLHRHFEESLVARGAIRINASKPLNTVVDYIIQDIRV